MDGDHDDPQQTEQFEKFEAEAREDSAAKNRERISQTRNVSTRSLRPQRDWPRRGR
jgi:hypothetical protein